MISLKIKLMSIINGILISLFSLFSYLLLHVMDIVVIVALFTVLYELIAGSFLALMNVSLLIFMYFFPFLLITLLFFVLGKQRNILKDPLGFLKGKYNKPIKILNINIPIFKRFAKIFKQYYYIFILNLNIIFLNIVFYFGLHQNSSIIIIIGCFYIFILLKFFLQYLLTKYNIIEKKSFNLTVSALFILIFGIFLSALVNLILNNLDFKLGLPEYLYGIIQHRDRLFYKFQKDNTAHWTWFFNAFRKAKLDIHFFYLKQLALNKNLLNDVIQLDYWLNSDQSFYNRINNFKLKLNSLKIEEYNLKLLNKTDNNIYINDQNVWYDIYNGNDYELYQKCKALHLNSYKESVNWKFVLKNLHGYNWNDFTPVNYKQKKISFFFKKKTYFWVMLY